MMKIIFFGAGYCSRFIIPLLPKKTEIICTHKSTLKKEGFDSFGGFKSFKKQLFNISKERCGLFWNKINLCLVNESLYSSPLIRLVSEKKTSHSMKETELL